MASKRKIAANQRNARKSTGPRSGVGKRRASRNSRRHGLSSRGASSAERATRVEELARQISGLATDVVPFEWARDAADAEFDLAQIRQVKIAVIQRMLALCQPPTRPSSESLSKTVTRSAKPESLVEAVRLALPELLKLDRYEQHAAVVRERSLRAIKCNQK
jgi:hypothetical protein